MENRIKSDNLALLYQQAAESYEDLPAFATRRKALEWEPVSFRQLYEQGLNLATGLISLGLNARDHIGHFGDNRYEWILADCGVQISGAANVPRGRDVSDDELLYIIEHAGIEVTFVETQKLMDRVLALKDKLPKLREIIVLDSKAKLKEGVKSLQEITDKGESLRKQGNREAEKRIQQIKPDDLFTLIYTSGTTGKPKGVMLTHSNMISQIRNLPGNYNCTDRILSVLPIWHIFERVIEMYTVSFGGCTYYSSIISLGEDMRNIEPTFMASAPRLWEKLHERIIKSIKASHPVRQVLFHIAYFLSVQYKNSEYFITNRYLKVKPAPLWKRALFMPLHVLRWLLVLPWYGFFNAAVLERIRLGAGGSLRATISGGGALPLHIDKFFNYVGIPVMEGYGMTETSPVISVRPGINLIVGTVGPPIKETEIKLVDTETGELVYPNPDLPWNGRSKRGEIWVKGPQVMKGYYKESLLTNQTIKNGWLRTGDVGLIDHNNCLKILGRIKSTIVLSSGENVEPEPIEMQLQQSPFIEHCMIVGQDKKFLSVLIVPGLEKFRERGFVVQSAEELANIPEVHNIIKEEIRKTTSASNGYKRYEQIKDFRLLTDTFQVGHELTNLYKIKRHVVEKKFNHVIEELFAKETSKTL